MTTQLPLVIRALNERLHFRYWGPQRVVRLDTFNIDLSDWKLAFTDRTPCFWIHTPPLLSAPPLELAEEIRDAVRTQLWQNETVLVLVDGPARKLRDHLAGSFTQFVVLDEEQQKSISEAPSPTRVMLDMVLNQVSRAQLAPYQTSRPVTGSRFFGRQSYLNKILNHPKSNFLIIGIRRIGKSSLLHEVERRLDLIDPPDEDQHRRLYVDCSVLTSADELYREIVGRLNPSALKRLLGRGRQSLRFQSQMFEYLADENGGQITYLLDEIDGLLKYLGPDLSLFEVLRRVSQQEGVARFIMAGFREARRAINNGDTPFYNLGETLRLDALELTEVKQMVEVPMDSLRVRLPNRDEILHRIYRETAGMPNLVQFYCQTLLEQLDRSGGKNNVISVEDLQYVYENANFRDFVVETFIRNSLPLERAIVFAMIGARHDHEESAFSQKEIDQELRQRKLKLRFSDLDEACGNLVTAGILRQTGRQYTFSIPLFARMLQENYPVDYVFEKARGELLAPQGLP